MATIGGNRYVQLLAVALLGLLHSSSGTPTGYNHDHGNNNNVFLPEGLALGSQPTLQTSNFQPFTLQSSTPLATIDYGIERAGHPYFLVSAVIGGSAQVEVKYTEHFPGLAQAWSDGPYSFSNSLANTFRVETFNFTRPGQFASFMLQGGQRWQSLRLISGSSITFWQVGFQATIATDEVDNLPGHFDSDDDTLNDIWDLGARSATAACVAKGTQGPAWRVDYQNGILVENYRPALSVKANDLANYTLNFQAKINRGGIHWGVAWPVAFGSGIQLGLVGELPAASTFANTNRSLTPPNSIMLADGYDFVNQTTLPAYYLDTFIVPFSVHEGQWYNISSTLLNGRLSVAIDGTSVFNVTLASYYAGGTPISTTGSFGFGTWQDQSAYFRNVQAYDAANGSLLYSNPMTSTDVLAEYGTQANVESVCLDGPKRDRLVWLGDFYHTSRIIGTSTSRFDLAKGTLQEFLNGQTALGPVPISPPMGYNQGPEQPFSTFSVGGLNDYQILGFLAFYEYIRASKDLDFARSTWPQWQRQLSWLQSRINATDGLVHVISAFLGPAAAGSAVSCAAVQALNNAATIATALGDTSSATNYSATASSLATNINDKLWNDKLGVYAVSTSNLTDYSVAGISFCITSNVSSLVSGNRTQRSLAALANLKLGPGYKDATQADASDPTTNISPNTNGFLLSALFQSGAYTTGGNLIRSLWGAMIAKDEYNTGASWEYVNAATSAPGLSLFTSLAHPWGGAATYILTEYGAGLRTADGSAGFGWKQWVVDPSGGLAMGLKRARARVVTAFGGDIEVNWVVKGNAMIVTISAPRGTQGAFTLGATKKVLSGRGWYVFTVQV